MIYAIGFIIVAIILIFITYPKSKISRKKLKEFLKWSKKFHGRKYNFSQINNKVISESKNIKISYDFHADQGIYEDKSQKFKVKIIYADNKFLTT